MNSLKSLYILMSFILGDSEKFKMYKIHGNFASIGWVVDGGCLMVILADHLGSGPNWWVGGSKFWLTS